MIGWTAELGVVCQIQRRQHAETFKPGAAHAVLTRAMRIMGSTDTSFFLTLNRVDAQKEPIVVAPFMFQS